LLAFSTGHLGVQGIEPLLPQAPIPVEPFIDFCEGFRAKGVDPPLSLLANLDKARLPQHTEVPRYTWASDRKQSRQLTRSCRTVGQRFQQRSPTLVCHRPKNSLHVDKRIRTVT
jgi:hypothetical protein